MGGQTIDPACDPPSTRAICSEADAEPVGGLAAWREPHALPAEPDYRISVTATLARALASG